MYSHVKDKNEMCSCRIRNLTVPRSMASMPNENIIINYKPNDLKIKIIRHTNCNMYMFKGVIFI